LSYAEPYIAQFYQLSWGEETAYLTRPTNINQYLRLHSAPTFPDPVREIEVVHAPGHGRGPAYVNDQMKWALDGTLPFEVITGEFFGAIFGLCVTTGSSPWTHTFNLSAAMPKSFAVQIAWLMSGNNLVQEYLGCRASKATFKASEDSERLLCDVDYLAAKPQDGGDTEETITTNINPPFMFKTGVFSSTALYTGAKARIYSFELPINLNAKANYAGGYQYYPYEILPGKADFGELKLTIGIKDDVEWNEIYDPTKAGTVYDYEYLLTRGASDTCKFSGNAKLKSGPITADEHDVRRDLILVPYTCTVEVVDTTEIYPFE